MDLLQRVKDTLAANAEKNGEQDFIKDSILVMGELELSGKIRPIKGVNAAVSTAASCGIDRPPLSVGRPCRS